MRKQENYVKYEFIFNMELRIFIDFCFQESEMPSRKDLRREQPVSDLSIRRRAQSRAGVENTLALSSISGDATACDQQFTRLVMSRQQLLLDIFLNKIDTCIECYACPLKYLGHFLSNQSKRISSLCSFKDYLTV